MPWLAGLVNRTLRAKPAWAAASDSEKPRFYRKTGFDRANRMPRQHEFPAEIAQI
jgi:hypothetical protein